MTSGPATRPPGPVVVDAAGPVRWAPVAGGAVVGGAVTAGLLSGGWVERLDERVAASVGAWHLRGSAASVVLEPVAQLGGRAVLAVVLLGVAGWAGWRRGTARPLVQAVLALAALTVAVYAVKLGAGRAAPTSPAGPAFAGHGTSFPSGHVANAVVVWGVVRRLAVAHRMPVPLQRTAAALALLGPLLTGLAVLLLDFHWLSDVVVGAAIGVSLLGVVHALDGVVLSLWVRARAGRRSA